MKDSPYRARPIFQGNEEFFNPELIGAGISATVSAYDFAG
jgi:hypothetical protein